MDVLQELKRECLRVVDMIDSGQCKDLSDAQALRIMEATVLLIRQSQAPISREKVASDLGISMSTLKNYVRDGYLPEAHALRGFKEKGYYQSEIDEAVERTPWIKREKK